MAFLREPTGLHMFVVTLRCEHSCPYCQVSRQSTDRTRFDMSEEIAERALQIALHSPSSRIKIEFQGGEPMLNFSLIAKIVENAKSSAPKTGKQVDFVIASNLALLTDDILAFCKRNNVLLSTSLDGPADLHNRNRPRPGGNSYELAVKGIKEAQKVLGADRVSALMTTTEASLNRVEEIIDEYVALGLDGIFLRPLSPYGFAIKTKQIKKYDAKRWLDFYVRGLRYILDINRRGHNFFEFYTLLLLRRMLTDEPIGYVDLRSPTGVGLGALVYNYDGKVFASDEGRMLAEMGDNTFELGHVERDSYRSLILSDKLIGLVGSSLTQCAPECLNCVYESHCGADPVYHHATQNDPLGLKPLSGFCARQKGVMGTVLDLLDHSPEDAAVLRRWGGM
jgi:His-Xaa-Ser system radical SAM maturase HxsB